MKRLISNGCLAFALVLIAMAQATPAEAQDQGETVFRTVCMACHSAGSNRVVGPGLGGVLERRDHAWLVSKITQPDQLLAQGDAVSEGLVAEYGIAMPNLGTTTEQAEAVLAYLAQAAATPATDQAVASVPAEPPSAEQVALGQALFQGRSRFENRGASCISCHDVARAGVIGGGTLAVGLTDAYSRLGGTALNALLTNPPFPVMRRAFVDRPLTEGEVLALVAFLQQADAEQGLHSPPNYGAYLLAAGIVGLLLFVGISSLTWRGRRRGPVYAKVFDRQGKSS